VCSIFFLSLDKIDQQYLATKIEEEEATRERSELERERENVCPAAKVAGA
jgi:hypothetical protein